MVAAAVFFAAPVQAQTTPVWSTTMTVEETTGDTFGFSASGSNSGGSLDRDFFTVAGSRYTVKKLQVGTYDDGLVFDTDPQLSSQASYTLEFAGETLPLSDSDPQIAGFFKFTWLAANAPSLSETQFRTTLAVDKEVSVCLRTAAQVCPGGTTTNAAPVFGEGTTATRSVAENTAAGVDIGSPLTATDADNDSLEYTLGGTDEASFDIDSGTGQLQTKTGVDYNHEATKNSYSVTVEADDGNGNGGTATIAVTVTVTDVDERSRRPTMPVVMATPGTTDSLNVSWTKPGLVGGPDIVGYNVRHRVTGQSGWTTVQLTGTGLTTMISGLQAGTDYTVQVQARNGETPSLWSLDGEGSTGTTTTTTTPVWSTTMTVGEGTNGQRGFYGSEAVGSLDNESIMIGTTSYPVSQLLVRGDTINSALFFSLFSAIPSYADYTLVFAGETLPLTAGSSSPNADSSFYFPQTWVDANAPSLSAANLETTLPVGAMVSVCLRTATQVCPRGTTPTNTAATGQPGISGTVQVGQTLTATTSGISDADGKTNAENGDTGYAYPAPALRS